MDQKTFFIETWGCQMNDLDTQRMSGLLKLHGYRRVEHEDDASVVLLNTCSIREKSEKKVFDRLGRLRSVKARGGKLGVCGCVAQQEGETILRRAPHVDFVIGPGNVANLEEVLTGKRRLALDFPENRTYDYLSVDRPSATLAQVTVMEGCNKNCTFCIVPTTRGREVSRPLTEIAAEVRHAIGSGRVEIELLGQTVNAYRCPSTGSDFADLLSTVASISGVKRVRFMTSHPAEVTPRMIAAMKDHENIARYLHLPAQSGSSTVLRRMKRLYTREKYLEIVDAIRSAIPRMMLTTDFIVGFPGETDADFEQTLSLMERVRFGSLFAFKYSPRPGTPSLRIGAAVDEEIANGRLTRLFQIQERIERETLESYAGAVVPVLYDGASRHDETVLSGRSDQNLTVNFVSDRPRELGEMVAVRVDRAQHHTLRGEAVA